jgi:hypothetical protein
VTDIETLVQLRLALLREVGEVISDTEVTRPIDARHQLEQRRATRSPSRRRADEYRSSCIPPALA